MSTIHQVELDSSLRCPDAVDFERRLRERVVGQDEAIERVSWMVQTFMAGFNPPGRPAGILLFLGPDGFPHSRPLKNLVPTFSSPQRPLSNLLPLQQPELLVCGG
jgi:ATP-dependent Clp protease ATP-binding subunit ClpA